MLKYIILCASVITFVTAVAEDLSCPDNSSYAEIGYDCGTCLNPESPCFLEKSPKCYCQVGYVRNIHLDCVLQEDCTKSDLELHCDVVNETISDHGYSCGTCRNISSKCELSTVKQCYCSPGYVRDDSGKCILLNDCPENSEETSDSGEEDEDEEFNCGANSTLSTNGYDCTTCAYVNKPCVLERGERCYCNIGYVRKANDDCILPTDCTQADIDDTLCAKNETLANSGYSCSTCASFSKPCALNATKQCYCKPGYVRNASGRCIHLDDCPVGDTSIEVQDTICNSINETFATNGHDCASCTNPNSPCALENTPKCYCNTGYIRNSDQGCVLPKDCASEVDKFRSSYCPENQTFSSSGYSCSTCTNYSTPCELSFISQCYCNPGYVRDVSHNCIDLKDCPVCSENQTYALSGYECRTCSNVNDPGTSCLPSKESKCYCNDGFVLNEENGKCVLENDCPKLIEKLKCKQNETYGYFGYDCATCTNYKQVQCDIEANAKCYCNQNYVRHHDRCVSISDCKNYECDEMIMQKCDGCIATCQNMRPTHYMQERCRKNCQMCLCPPGQVRDMQLNCVFPKYCYTQTLNGIW